LNRHLRKRKLSRMTFKDYFEKQAAQPALAPRREYVQRKSCDRCDGEVFLIHSDETAICAGCGAPLRREKREI
jgi:hypothetical protein